MKKSEIARKAEEFVNSFNYDKNLDEWFCTDREFHRETLNEFLQFLGINKEIKRLEEED